MRQFVIVKFRPYDRRTYTYHNDGTPVVVGQVVEVETKDGPTQAAVTAVTDVEPTFATKPILQPIERGPGL